MNILILAAGQSAFETEDGKYPLFLTEIKGIPLIEHLINKLKTDAHLVFVLRKDDIHHHYVDSVVKQLVPDASIVELSDDTAGAACSALLAVEKIDNDDELLILNADELLDVNIQEIVNGFKTRNLDAGTIVFPSVHPRYSYVRLDDNGFIIEAAEKKPISRYATVGFYWFLHGSDFVQSVKNMIRKDAQLNGYFYICPVFNELILNHKKIGVTEINQTQYHPIKSARQLESLITHEEL
jgi:NDP-sugar pyrophosphorylase family protein